MFCNNKIIVAILSYWACTLFDQTIQKKNGQEDGLNIKDLNPEAGLILNKAKNLMIIKNMKMKTRQGSQLIVCKDLQIIFVWYQN